MAIRTGEGGAQSRATRPDGCQLSAAPNVSTFHGNIKFPFSVKDRRKFVCAGQLASFLFIPLRVPPGPPPPAQDDLTRVERRRDN